MRLTDKPAARLTPRSPLALPPYAGRGVQPVPREVLAARPLPPIRR